MGEVSRNQSVIGCTITHPQERTFQQQESPRPEGLCISS